MSDARLRVADYLEHIVATIEKIRRYSTGMERELEMPIQEIQKGL